MKYVEKKVISQNQFLWEYFQPFSFVLVKVYQMLILCQTEKDLIYVVFSLQNLHKNLVMVFHDLHFTGKETEAQV